MKAVFVNHSDSLGGASTVTRRLVEALRDRGIDATMLVTDIRRPEPWIHRTAPRWRARLPFYAEHLRIFAGNGHSRSDLFKASIATDGLPLSRHPLIRRADVVVLNWINQGMLSLAEIARIAADKPVIWTMHDMWNLTGVCHHAADCTAYTSGCGNCPLLHSSASPRDLSALTFARKAQAYAGIRFVAVSHWLASCAARSPLMHGHPIEVIPNSYDPVAPAPLSRTELGLPPTGPLVTMCAARLDDPVKGLPLAVEALNGLADTGATAVFVGAVRDPHSLDGLRIPRILTGPVDDAAVRQAIFAHSDAVLSSSLYESFGATLVEAQAAGTTPVAYVHDGRADIITDGISGYAADIAGGGDSLGNALRRALVAPIAADRLRAAAGRYAPDTVAAAYERLMHDVANHRRPVPGQD